MTEQWNGFLQIGSQAVLHSHLAHERGGKILHTEEALLGVCGILFVDVGHLEEAALAHGHQGMVDLSGSCHGLERICNPQPLVHTRLHHENFCSPGARRVVDSICSRWVVSPEVMVEENLVQQSPPPGNVREKKKQMNVGESL
jgi:hypothetical protein